MQAVLAHVQVHWRSFESELQVGAERARGGGVVNVETNAHVVMLGKKSQNSRPVAPGTMRQSRTPEVAA